MSNPARWTKHRPVALAIARDWNIPGLDRDDVRQEALVALWEACRAYDDTKGQFPAFARLVIKRRLLDLHRAATREKRTAEFAEYTENIPAPDHEQLVLVGLDTLSDRERLAVTDHLNGMSVLSSKEHDNALFRARRKLSLA